MEGAFQKFRCFFIVFICVLFTQKATKCADISTMEGNLRDYFSQTRHHDVDQAYKDRAMSFIYNEFRNLGLETHYHEFQETRVSTEKKFTNVIGILKGEKFGNVTDRIVGVAAHYDTVATTAGVDDNGAGVVAMLDVAKQLTDMNRAGWKRNNTIMFVSFDVEEQGLFGSQAFVSSWLPGYLQEHYGPGYTAMRPYGVVVMDTMMEFNTSANSQLFPPGSDQLFQQYFPHVYSSVQSDGFQGDFILLIYRGNSVDSELADSFNLSWAASGRTEFEIEAFPLPISDVSVIQSIPALRHFLRSDHRSFWVAEIPAIFLSDSANFRGDMVHCYHAECDNLDVMLTEDNIKFLGKTADSIKKALGQLSEPYRTEVSSGDIVLPSYIISMCLAIMPYRSILQQLYKN